MVGNTYTRVPIEFSEYNYLSGGKSQTNPSSSHTEKGNSTALGCLKMINQNLSILARGREEDLRNANPTHATPHRKYLRGSLAINADVRNVLFLLGNDLTSQKKQRETYVESPCNAIQYVLVMPKTIC